MPVIRAPVWGDETSQAACRCTQEANLSPWVLSLWQAYHGGKHLCVDYLTMARNGAEFHAHQVQCIFRDEQRAGGTFEIIGDPIRGLQALVWVVGHFAHPETHSGLCNTRHQDLAISWATWPKSHFQGHLSSVQRPPLLMPSTHQNGPNAPLRPECFLTQFSLFGLCAIQHSLWDTTPARAAPVIKEENTTPDQPTTTLLPARKGLEQCSWDGYQTPTSFCPKMENQIEFKSFGPDATNFDRLLPN